MEPYVEEDKQHRENSICCVSLSYFHEAISIQIQAEEVPLNLWVVVLVSVL